MSESFAGNYLADEDAISLYCDLIGATSASVKLSGNIITLTINGTPQTVDLSTHETLTKAVDAINAITGWTATLLGVSSKASKNNMADQAEADALGSENTVTLKTLFDDVDNFPSGWEAVQKKEYVDAAEELIEKCTRDFFYALAFDIKKDGNGQDRLHFGFYSDVLSVSKLYVYGVEIDSTLWTFDKRSIYLDTETAIGSWAEWRALRAELSTEVLFPKGLKNIRIIGTKGRSSCPLEIRQACAMIIKDRFDETLYDHWRAGTFSIGGDLSYNNPADVYTGIVKVDRIIRRYVRKRPLLATTGTRR